jgi:hypothetical protein
MVRIWIVGSALVLALAAPAAAQPRSIPEVLERLHTLCDQNYTPACIKLVMGRLPKLRRSNPDWWWWERW